MTKRRMTDKARADVEESIETIKELESEIKELKEEEEEALKQINLYWEEIAKEITEIETDSELSFELEPGSVLTPTKNRPNTLGFIPAVEVLNKPNSSGTEGEGEFDPFMEQIVLHNQLTNFS